MSSSAPSGVQGYRTGYAYRFPVLSERARTRRDVEVPATATVFHQFDEDGVPLALRQNPFTQRQQERTRWLNTPNTYLKVNSQETASPGHLRTTVRGGGGLRWTVNRGRCCPLVAVTVLCCPDVSVSSVSQWLKTEEVTQAGSTSMKMENPNQFVPLFTNPREVIETRNKVGLYDQHCHHTSGVSCRVLPYILPASYPPVCPTLCQTFHSTLYLTLRRTLCPNVSSH